MPIVINGQFEWDADKAEAVWRRRGIHLEHMIAAFADRRLLSEPNMDGSSDERWLGTGMVGDQLYTVVYAYTEDRIRIITAWRATREEQDAYFTAG